jgi:heat shock protein HtpX
MPSTSTPRDPTTAGGVDLAGQITANRRRAAVLVTACGTLVGLVVAVVLFFVVPWPVVVVVAILAGAAAGWAVATLVPARALRLAGGVPADPAKEARLFNLVEGLSLAAGVPPPALYLVDHDAPNAMTVGSDPRRARLLVTTGLLSRLNRIELEGVLAHELSHIRCHDIRTGTLAVGVLSLAAPLGAPAQAVSRWLVGPLRETVADLRAVSLTRYPPGLIAALETLRALETPDVGHSPALLPLWFFPPEAVADRPAEGSPVPSHSTLDARIEALREL